MSPRALIVLWLALAFVAALRAAPPPPLILVSLDAFRWDYSALHPAETVNLRRLAAAGASARQLIPVFPSNTFPNHYTIATGLWPSHHGIINNHIFDPALGEFFHYNQAHSARDSRWWRGEPIWITAVRQGRASACSFWPGSEAEIGGQHATYWKPYDYKHVSFEQRLDEVVGWLLLPAEKCPAIITFYLEETNAAGHTFGPDSAFTLAAIKLLDHQVGALEARLRTEGIAANLIIVSDHGMVATGTDHAVVLDDYLDWSRAQLDFDGAAAGLRPLDGDTAALLRAAAKVPHARAFRAEELPARFHIDAKNPRVPPVWLVAEEGVMLVRRSFYERTKAFFTRGEHGYDPALNSMRGILIASGPAFRPGAVAEPVENVHVYNLLCAAIGLRPAPNDGDDRLVRALLR